MPPKQKGKTLEVKPSDDPAKGRCKQSKTIQTDLSACTSDRIFEKQRQQTAQITAKASRSNIKTTLKREEPQMDLRKDINNKINGLRSAQTIGSLAQNSKQLLGKEMMKEAASSRVGQFIEKYKSSYRM